MIDVGRALPKAELHLHIEGTLEPELMFRLAQRNGVELPYPDVEAVRAAYVFDDLQSFLDIYYAGCRVLVTEQDFYDLTAAYLERAAAQGVRHAEIFFDPQTHTDRDIAFATVIDGITRALADGEREHGITSRVILCFLRDLERGVGDGDARRRRTAPREDHRGRPRLGRGRQPAVEVPRRLRPSPRRGVPDRRARGEEGPPAYMWEALDLLHVRRIDHGVRCTEDEALVERLVGEQVPLTVCPLSNVKLRVFDTLADHNLATLLRRGLLVTVNSDDPAYFGGYVADNFRETAAALALTDDEVLQLARNSFLASFLDDDARAQHLEAIDAIQR